MRTADLRPIRGHGWYAFAAVPAIASTGAIVGFAAWLLLAPDECQQFLALCPCTMKWPGRRAI